MTQKEQWIRYKDRVKLEDTAPERAFDQLAKGLNPVKPQRQSIIDEDGLRWDFRPDREVRGCWVEILGPYHWTSREEAKTRWRSNLIVRKTGRRLLLIDAPLLEDKSHWPYVLRELERFLLGSEPWKRLFA